MKSNKYLYEYQYFEIEIGNYNIEKVNYWKTLLGEKVFEYCERNNPNFRRYLSGQLEEKVVNRQQDMGNFIKTILKTTRMYVKEWKNQDDVFFAEFYAHILNYGIEELMLRLSNKKIYLKDSVYVDFAYHLVRQLQGICLRTLITEMHEYKRKGLLIGETSEEEYSHFCKKIIEKEDFVKETFEEYPVMCRCVKEKVEYMVKFYEEIINYFWRDKDEICNYLCGGEEINEIISIKGDFSDVHNNGKQVLKIKLDNNKEILYKPHTMANEKFFNELLEWTSSKVKIDQLQYPFLSYDDHSWSTIVEYKTCESEEQLKKYYFRLGIQLFWAYLLGTKDLHFENIIASGEYPVLIDLETLVNIQYNYNRSTVNEEIFYQLSQSVLYTGILPYYSWIHEGSGINNSAISGGHEETKYPFKVPVILNPASSEMKIGYEFPSSKRQRNLATIQGEFITPENYKNDIIQGFWSCYNQVLKNKQDVKQILRGMINLYNRFLVADTQQYAMLLSSSYHPSLLKNGAEREIFLNSIRKNRKEKDDMIIDREIKSLLNGDVPYFTYQTNDTELFDMNGKVKKDYFNIVPFEIINNKILELNEKDLNRQCELIEMSLLITSKNEKYFINHTYKVQKRITTPERNVVEVVNLLLNRILDYAIWNCDSTEVNWSVMQITSSITQNWIIKPMGYYMYDGLAGMLLLFEVLDRKFVDKGIKAIKNTLKNQLFNYTDQGIKSLVNLQSRNTGAYDGESSIIYVYLALYKKTNELQYLEYAERHVRIISELILGDDKFDLISGNAGAAFVLMKLYKIVQKEEYLNMAKDAIEVLKKNAIKKEKGIGWITEKNMPPMAGMAHGNAGILMAVLEIWKYTKNEKYMDLVWEIWEYENSLYDLKINNWKDLRNNGEFEDPIGTVAWCHGAAGILLSRIISIRGAEQETIAKELEWDIIRAYSKVKKYYERDSLCLCHGTLGNLWILQKCQKQYYPEEYECKILENIKVQLLPQEKLNFGLMNGLGGMVYYLLKLKEEKCKMVNILMLE